MSSVEVRRERDVEMIINRVNPWETLSSGAGEHRVGRASEKNACTHKHNKRCRATVNGCLCQYFRQAI